MLPLQISWRTSVVQKETAGVADELPAAVMVGTVGLEWGAMNPGTLAHSVLSCRVVLENASCWVVHLIG